MQLRIAVLVVRAEDADELALVRNDGAIEDPAPVFERVEIDNLILVVSPNNAGRKPTRRSKGLS